MRKLTMVLVLAVAVFWANAAFAQSYSALDDSGYAGPYIGVGGIAITGDDSAGGSASEFLPTVSISGMSDYVVWQAFYGFGDTASAFGGSVDYVLASNFDECATCPDDSLYWFGAGASLISYTDLFADGTVAGLDDTELGANLGGGLRWDQWGLDVYLHYFPSSASFGVQGALLYNFSD
jgi:hypothetical protein